MIYTFYKVGKNCHYEGKKMLEINLLWQCKQSTIMNLCFSLA